MKQIFRVWIEEQGRWFKCDENALEVIMKKYPQCIVDLDCVITDEPDNWIHCIAILTVKGDELCWEDIDTENKIVEITWLHRIYNGLE